MTIVSFGIYTECMSKKNFAVLVLTMCFLTVLLTGGRSSVYAQTATDSADESATDSSTTKGGTTDEDVVYPEELLETGSNDILFASGIGVFLILAGIMSRVALSQLTREE